MGNFFKELKRRKVFRVGAVYAVVAWLLIQVASTILPTFEAPDWVNQTITLLFILGFPLALILAWAYEVIPEGVRSNSRGALSTQTQSSPSQVLTYATFILVLLVAGIQLSDRFLFNAETQTTTSTGTDQPTPNGPFTEISRRFSINIGSTIPFGGPFTNTELSLSPDGTKLVYGVFRQDTGSQHLVLKYLDRMEEQELPFLGQASSPFFSADGAWVAFVESDGNGLYKVPVLGGPPQLIADFSRAGNGGFWSVDGTIFYTSADRQLMKLSPDGVDPESVITGVINSNTAQSWPYLLPGSDALIYTEGPADNLEGAHINLLRQSTGEVTTIIPNAYNARYAPSGHIVFMRGGALWAVPFDVEQLRTIGAERTVLQGVQTNDQRGPTPYAFSDDGLLVYLPGGVTNAGALKTTLIWVDRDGNEEVLSPTESFRRWAVSPDGRKIAVSINEGGTNADIWTYDLARNTLSRLTFDESNDYRPLWTPDGKRIVFASNREDVGGLWWKSADGTGAAERLFAEDSQPFPAPYAFTPDGTKLLYFSGGDIYILNFGAEVLSQPLLQSEFQIQRPALSPDGRWLAYSSNETGRMEIYVRPFPNIDGGKWQISSAGGISPKWSPDGLELFFSRPPGNDDRGVWVARRESADMAQFSAPARAFTGSDAVVSEEGTFDISTDGSSILLRRDPDITAQETDVTLLMAVDNWFAELKRLAPPDPE